MKRLTVVVTIGALVVLTCSAALAFFGAPPDLKTDASSADAIAVGGVLGTHYGLVGRDGMRSVTIDFRVDRVLKGDIARSEHIAISYKCSPNNDRQGLSGYDLVLLKKEGGNYTFSRDSLSSMPVSGHTSAAYAKSDNVEANLRWEMINSLQDTEYVVVEKALEQRSVLSQDDIVANLKPRISDPNPRIRAEALKACIEAGDSTLIPSALSFAADGAQMQESSNQYYFGILRRTLENSARPENLPLFFKLLKHDSAKARDLAIRALRASNSPSALPYLQSGLDDPDQTVRYDAVMGLAMMTRDLNHGPSADKFREEEKGYLDYWKSKKLD